MLKEIIGGNHEVVYVPLYLCDVRFLCCSCSAMLTCVRRFSFVIASPLVGGLTWRRYELSGDIRSSALNPGLSPARGRTRAKYSRSVGFYFSSSVSMHPYIHPLGRNHTTAAL